MRSVRSAMVVTLALLGTTVILGLLALDAIRRDVRLKSLEQRKKNGLRTERAALQLHRRVEEALRNLTAISGDLSPKDAAKQLDRELSPSGVIWQGVALTSDGDLIWPTLPWNGPEDRRLDNLAKSADCAAYQQLARSGKTGLVAILRAALTIRRRDRGCDIWPAIRTALYVDSHLSRPSARDWNFFTHRGSGTWVMTTARTTLILKPFRGGWLGFALRTDGDIAATFDALPAGSIAYVSRQPSLQGGHSEGHFVRLPSPLQGYALFARFPAISVALPWPLIGIVALCFGFAGWASWFIVRGARQRERQIKWQQDLFSSITHELKSPVAAQIALTETLLSHDLDAAQRAQYHQRLITETQRLSRLIEKVLTLNRSQYSDVPREVCNLTLICHEILESVESQAAERRHQVSFDDRQPAWIEVDAQGIRLAVGNLVDNALKYTRSPGEVRLELARGDGRVSLLVRDSGPGIPEHLRATVFEPFTRGDDRAEAGSGLGLFLARRIVTANGGELRLLPEQSETCGGVELVLPLHPNGGPR